MRFRQHVLTDRQLQEQLREMTDLQEFISLVVSLGKERGFEFTGEDVEETLNEGRRAWIERGI